MSEVPNCRNCGQPAPFPHSCKGLQAPPLQGRKYDCESCGATVDGHYLQIHMDWHENIELMAETVVATRMEQLANAKRTQR